jgi:hypothetical protein
MFSGYKSIHVNHGPISVVRELGIMHLVVGHETYKTTFGIMTKAFGRIIEFPMKVGGIVCQMVLLVVNTNNYDLLLGLDFFMKIGIVVDYYFRILLMWRKVSYKYTMEMNF